MEDDCKAEKAKAAFAKAKEMMRLKKLAKDSSQQNNVDFSKPQATISNGNFQQNAEWQHELTNIAQEFNTQEMKSDIAMTYNAETNENGSFKDENMSPHEFVKTMPLSEWSFQVKLHTIIHTIDSFFCLANVLFSHKFISFFEGDRIYT